jgi:NADPH-dependent glutamate synthase beta subunit-like oxidoreductase
VRRLGTERTIDTDLVFLAIGFAGVRPSPLFEQLDVALERDTLISVDADLRAGPAVVAAGDAVIGAALVVNAIADGRRAAATCDLLLQDAPHAAAV